jgi:glycosyltransferase involved in cell wall biosynthesis
MMEPAGASIRSVLMLSPEPPYPMNGGGAFRVASLVHYFAQFAQVDLLLFSESGKPAILPPGLVRSQTVIPLPFHQTGAAARYLRNARRAFQGVPPLIDRLSGHAVEIARALAGKHYDLGIVEHFWCAPYLPEIAAACDRTILDLHNIESVLHERCAQTDGGLVGAGHRRFAACARKLEEKLLPGYSMALATSEADAIFARKIAPGASVQVFPNSLPSTPVPRAAEQPVVVFAGNFEYHPNIDSVMFLTKSIWPEVQKRCPDLRLRLVGRGDRFIRHLLPSGLEIEVTGPVDDALAEIAAARIVIAPLRTGSGTRIKILEAWAAARPVVATSLAAEGLEYRENCDLLIANGGPSIAGAIAGLNADPEGRARVGASGRLVFEQRHTWDAAWLYLDSAVSMLSGSTSTSTGHRYTEGSDANRR